MHCHSAALLFGKTIRMRPRQRLDQRGFAVVDVSGCANNNALHCSGHIRMGEILLPLWMLLEERSGGQTAATILRRRFRQRWLARRRADRRRQEWACQL